MKQLHIADELFLVKEPDEENICSIAQFPQFKTEVVSIASSPYLVRDE
jgi:hypothetical protein